LAPGLLGASVAGGPDRHRGWLLCPSSVPAAAGRGLRPRVAFPAHRPLPQLQVQAPAGMGAALRPVLWQSVFRPAQPPFTCPVSQSDQVLCRFRLALGLDRPSGTPAVCILPSRYVASVVLTGLLRRPPRCSVITQRARMQQRASSETASVSACAASCFVARVQASREEKTPTPPSPIPAEREPRGCLHAGGEQRGHLAAPGRQTKWRGYHEGPLASGIGSFSHGRAAQALGAQDFIA
jgi:hypothetical protein